MSAGAAVATSGSRTDRSRRPIALAVQYAVDAPGLPARSTIRRWADAALSRRSAVVVRFVGAREARALNARYRGKDYPTNVLTFVYDDERLLTGDLVLCVPVIRREAQRQRIAFTAHCAHLVVHGLLHLSGYEHERPREASRMEALETTILARLGYADPYASRPVASARAGR